MPATVRTASTVSRNASLNVATGGFAPDTVNGDTFPNDGRTLMVVRTTGTATTPTVKYAVTLDGSAPAGRSLGAAGATATTVYGPFPPETYGSMVEVTWSSATGASVVIVQPTL